MAGRLRKKCEHYDFTCDDVAETVANQPILLFGNKSQQLTLSNLMRPGSLSDPEFREASRRRCILPRAATQLDAGRNVSSCGGTDIKRHADEVIVDLALETSGPLLDAARHHVRVVLPHDPVLLTVDPTRITQVLSNILNNAAKYTPHGGQLRLRAERLGPDRIHVEVEDNGAGIPPDMLESVVDLFTQVDPRSGRSQGGLGIELSLARRLVELHDGTVRARSVGPGLGSTFIVELPAMPPGETTSTAGLAKATSGPAKKSVLVVDDNVDGAEMLAMLLRVEGHAVRVVHTGNDALTSFSADEAPDIVFLDIGLPDRNGYEVAAELRRQPHFDRTVLVALTGWGTERDRQRAREAGFDLHIKKPISFEALGNALASNRSQPPRPQARSEDAGEP